MLCRSRVVPNGSRSIRPRCDGCCTTASVASITGDALCCFSLSVQRQLHSGVRSRARKSAMRLKSAASASVLDIATAVADHADWDGNTRERPVLRGGRSQIEKRPRVGNTARRHWEADQQGAQAKHGTTQQIDGIV